MSAVPLDADAPECPFEEATHWIEVELLGSDDTPIAYEPVEVKLAGGETKAVVLDANGWIRVGPFADGGNCEVSFPHLDRRAWAFIDSLAERAGGFVPGRRRERRAAGLTAVIQAGECCSSIAEASGHLWGTIWNDPANDAVRRDWDDPNCLNPGQGLAIPAIEAKTENRAVDQRHRFRFDNASKLVIRLAWPDGTVRNNVGYQITIDGVLVGDAVSADGIITIDRLRPGAKRGQLLVRGNGVVQDQRFRFDLGTLRPFADNVGVQQRLRNLGHRATETGGGDTAKAQAAVRDVQRAAGLAATGLAADIAAQLRADHKA